MSVLSFLGGLVKPVTDLIDNLHTSDEEKAQAKQKLTEIIQSADAALDAEVTKRHQADMTSDSWLSKNIRPLSLIFFTGIFTIISFMDGNVFGFKLNPAYIPVYQSVLVTIYIFYFGSRGYVKGVKLKNERKNGK